MKKILSSIVLVAVLILNLSIVNSAQAKTISVKGYYKKSTRSYVAPHYKTSANKTRLDNFSTKGNINPYSGKKGYKSPFKTYKFK